MEPIREWIRKYPVILSVLVGLLIVISSLLILIAPFKIQVAGVRDLIRPSVIETINSFELEKIGNGVLQEEVLTKEDGTYLGTQLADTLLTVLPGSVEIELSLSDIEYIFGQYSDTRSFVESSAVSSDIIIQTILGMVIDEIFGTHAIETEEQIFQIINLYRTLFYCLILMSLVSIALVFFRRKFAVIIWIVPATIISTGLAVAATLGSEYVAQNLYEEMYIRFPVGMLVGLALAIAAQWLYHKGLQIKPAPALEAETQDRSESQVAPAVQAIETQPQAEPAQAAQAQAASEVAQPTEPQPQAEPAQAAPEIAQPTEPQPQAEAAQPAADVEQTSEPQADEQSVDQPVETEPEPEAEPEVEHQAEPEVEQPTEQPSPTEIEQAEPEAEQTTEPEPEVPAAEASQLEHEATQQLKAQTGPNIKVQVVPAHGNEPAPADDSCASEAKPETKTIEIKLTIDVSTL